MSASSFYRRTPAIIRVELVACAVTFLLATLAHLGLRFSVVTEPPNLPAAVVEALCSACLTVAAVGVFARATWAWRGSIAAHVVSIAGVALGVVVQLRGTGTTELNVVYHRIVLAVLLAGLVLLVSASGRRALRGRGSQLHVKAGRARP